MIWLLFRPIPPLPSASCLSFSVFLCVAGQAYWRESGGEGGRGGAKSYHHEKAWFSINHSILTSRLHSSPFAVKNLGKNWRVQTYKVRQSHLDVAWCNYCDVYSMWCRAREEGALAGRWSWCRASSSPYSSSSPWPGPAAARSTSTHTLIKKIIKFFLLYIRKFRRDRLQTASSYMVKYWRISLYAVY